MSLFRIAGGTIYDPANGIDGAAGDLWIEDGRIVAAPSDPAVRPTRTLDATGYVVMPGGVDMHCHIAGPKVNVARKMRPEEKRAAAGIPRADGRRSGTVGSIPSTFATGALYAGLGYTTAVDAAVPALYARHVHEEFSDTPYIDRAFLTLVGNNHFILEQIQKGQPQQIDAYIGWLLKTAKAFGLKAVNPGGIEQWKEAKRQTITNLDQKVDYFQVTPREILRELTAAADRLHLPHSLHIHCNNLGMPGNWTTTLETMKAVEANRAHMAHIQFHSYGGGPDDEFSFSSAVPKLVDYFNAHRNLTVDVGHITFGATTSLTGDGPLGYYLHRVTGNKWFSSDTELETGCGIVPIEYRDKTLIGAIQWAAGLEWYLLADDPWRIAMSTDHPNGGAFLRYPETIAVLMDRGLRGDILKSLPEKIAKRTVLADIQREYTLSEIAILTRAAPARILGMKNKGHLGAGADADITIYSPSDDRRKMFEFPRYVIQAGRIVLDDGELRGEEFGQTFFTAPDHDADVVPVIRDWFAKHSSIRFENYGVMEEEVSDVRETPCP